MLDTLLHGGIKSTEVFITNLLSLLFVIFCTMPVHEAAHAFVAHKLGDNTAKYQGRLTLNPIRHINYIGALLILLFGFGWAEPVPVNQWNLKKPKRDMALIAAAGPLSNVIVAMILLFTVNIIDAIAGFCGISIEYVLNHGNLAIVYTGANEIVITALQYFIDFLNYAALINIGLAGFNLIPFPPLDGSRIFGAFLPDKIYYKLQSLERYAFFILIALSMTGVLSNVFGFIGEYIFIAVYFITSLPFSLLGLNMPFTGL